MAEGLVLGWPPAAGGGIFYQDTFTETTNTELAAHTPDVGTGSYVKRDGDTVTVTASTDTLNIANNVSELFYFSQAPTSANYTVTALVEAQFASITGIVGSCARMDSSSGYDGYCVEFQLSTGPTSTLLIKRYDNGTGTTLHSYDMTALGVVHSTWYQMVISVEGSNITGTIKSSDGGTTIYTYTVVGDTTYSDAGYAGGIIYDDAMVITSIEAQ